MEIVQWNQAIIFSQDKKEKARNKRMWGNKNKTNKLAIAKLLNNKSLK